MSSAKTFTKTSSILPNLWRVVSLTDPGLKCQAALSYWRVTICAIQIPSLCNEQDKSEWQTCSLFVHLPLWADSHWSWERLCIFLTHVAATCLATFYPQYLQGGGSYHVLSGQRGHERHDQRQRPMDQPHQQCLCQIQYIKKWKNQTSITGKRAKNVPLMHSVVNDEDNFFQTAQV